MSWRWSKVSREKYNIINNHKYKRRKELINSYKGHYRHKVYTLRRFDLFARICIFIDQIQIKSSSEQCRIKWLLLPFIFQPGKGRIFSVVVWKCSVFGTCSWYFGVAHSYTDKHRKYISPHLIFDHKSILCNKIYIAQNITKALPTKLEKLQLLSHLNYYWE